MKRSSSPLLPFLLGITLSAQTRPVSDAEVIRVHRAALLIDSHNDVPYYTVQGRDIGTASASPHANLAELKSGNVGEASSSPSGSPKSSSKATARPTEPSN